jgi:hypothetical protein
MLDENPGTWWRKIDWVAWLEPPIVRVNCARFSNMTYAYYLGMVKIYISSRFKRVSPRVLAQFRLSAEIRRFHDLTGPHTKENKGLQLEHILRDMMIC